MILRNKLFTFVFRHKWDKDNKKNFNSMFKSYNLGLWIKPYEAIASAHNYKKNGKFSCVKGCMIGLDLVIIKTWIDISFGKKLTFKL